MVIFIFVTFAFVYFVIKLVNAPVLIILLQVYDVLLCLYSAVCVCMQGAMHVWQFSFVSDSTIVVY